MTEAFSIAFGCTSLSVDHGSVEPDLRQINGGLHHALHQAFHGGLDITGGSSECLLFDCGGELPDLIAFTVHDVQALTFPCQSSQSQSGTVKLMLSMVLEFESASNEQDHSRFLFN